MDVKEYFEERDQLRCPSCNINDLPMLDEDEFPEEYKEGFRYVCSVCQMFFFEPVIELSDVENMIREDNDGN